MTARILAALAPLLAGGCAGTPPADHPMAFHPDLAAVLEGTWLLDEPIDTLPRLVLTGDEAAIDEGLVGGDTLSEQLRGSAKLGDLELILPKIERGWTEDATWDVSWNLRAECPAAQVRWRDREGHWREAPRPLTLAYDRAEVGLRAFEARCKYRLILSERMGELLLLYDETGPQDPILRLRRVDPPVSDEARWARLRDAGLGTVGD